MDYVRRLASPALRQPCVLAVFDGWSDTQSASTAVARYLIDLLPAKKFAELDPEEFYDFTITRPVAYRNQRDERMVRWPVNDFYSWVNTESDRDLIILLCTEPNLKWRTYVQTLMSIIVPCGASLVMTLGCLPAAVPHTRAPRLTAHSDTKEVQETLEGLGAQPIVYQSYQGPIGASSVLVDACAREGLSYARVWGHAPHYLQSVTNHRVAGTLFDLVNKYLHLSLPNDSIRQKARTFENEVNRALASNIEMKAYVKKLEEEHDRTTQAQEPLPNPQALVKDLEDFLKRQKRDNGGDKGS